MWRKECVEELEGFRILMRLYRNQVKRYSIHCQWNASMRYAP
ncbi:hypothetical protein BURMUCGD1_1765 [Burkholderia multivorans CGD1]|nr:hypothetical protein BURMUCGD1_1765 [Burkholderia multivorans CGD1]